MSFFFLQQEHRSAFVMLLAVSIMMGSETKLLSVVIALVVVAANINGCLSHAPLINLHAKVVVTV